MSRFGTWASVPTGPHLEFGPRASSEDDYDRLLPLILYLESRIAADAGGDETVLSAYIDLLSDLLSDTQVATSSHINHVQQTLLRLMLQTATQIQAS